MNGSVESPTIAATDITATNIVSFDHLSRLSDLRGLFEHADHLAPRLEHGYCTDDNARMLAITSRTNDTGAPRTLSRLSLAFVLDAQAPNGLFHNRMDIAGNWTDSPTDRKSVV